MKKTFSAKRNAIFSSTDISWGAYALAAVTVLLAVRLLFPNFFWFALTPVFKSAEILSDGSHAFFSSFRDASDLALRNEQLQAENASLLSVNQVLEQNAKGQEWLASNGILAGVIARPPESPYDTLVIAAGSEAGIVAGMKAFAEGGVPIGIVSSVLPDFARITLLSSPGAVTNGWVGSSNVPLTITGAGAGTFNASLTRRSDITVGDIVFVPGPGMLPIGRVARIDSDLSSSAMTLRIAPFVNPFSVGWVVVRHTEASLREAFAPPPSP